MIDMKDQTDERLQSLAQHGDLQAEEQLALRYSRLVRVCARPFFLAGGDSEDLMQEGMFGLLSAIRSFDPEKDASFHTYAELCIKRRLVDAVRAASRKKHSPLNEGVPFEEILSTEDSSAQSLYGAEAYRVGPEEQLLQKESELEFFSNFSRSLSRLEKQVLQLFLDGFSYTEIAERTERPVKSVDNAVQRIRRKLVRYLSPGENSSDAVEQ